MAFLKKYWVLIALALLFLGMRERSEDLRASIAIATAAVLLFFIGWDDLQRDPTTRFLSRLYIVPLLLLLAVSGVLFIVMIPAIIGLFLWFIMPPRNS